MRIEGIKEAVQGYGFGREKVGMVVKYNRFKLKFKTS